MKLNENFNQQEFIEWISGFLPDFSKDIRKVDVSKSFQGIKSIQTIGESSLGVRVYIIETEQDPSRRKIGLATESFTLLRDYGTPNAIIVYYSENSSLWRLSLLTSTLTWDEGKIKKKLSNPKRQSYVLGSKAKVKTPHQYLISKGSITDFADLKSRFSLEVVNKEFYKEISSAFIHLVGGQIANGKSKKTVEAQLKLPFVKDHSQTSQEFAVRLIGRIIFCWFLREKRSASGHSLMPRELLSFDASNTIEDYYHKILEPIFFEVLNKPIKTRKDAFINDLFSAIPYLNGGLFSPHEDDFFNYNEGKQAVNHNMVVVPDEWLKSLFEVLETFNFTIDENTSFDEELSIDPEMLGRIFENLLAEINPETGESARKSTGSYYTPRVIVDYMVDESLYLFLKEKTNILEEKLRSLISYDLEDDNSSPLNDEEKDKIAQALGSIKILDPACGSGAFPIGALQKIVFILQQIDQHGQLWFKKQIQNTPIELRKVIEREFQEKNFDYIRKLGIIRENIYGIDIQPIATEISRLRCFLTLVVDERIDDTLENRGIEPLPNLDFKFVTANTLVGLPTTIGTTSQVGLFEDNEGINELKEVRDMFFNASGFERDQLKLQFVQTQNKMFQTLISGGLRGHADMTSKLTTWDPFSHKTARWFDPEWMFGIKDGFDIVIANPPYIEFKKLGSENKKMYTSYRSAKGKYDIYVLFIEMAVNMLKSGGILTFINPTTFMQKDFGQEIRKIIKAEFSISHILDFNDFQVFSNVTNYTGVFIFSKTKKPNYSFGYHKYKNSKHKIDYETFASSLKSLKSEDFKDYTSINSNELDNLRWMFKNSELTMLIKKIFNSGTNLKDSSYSIFQGIASGKDEVFYVHEDDINKYSLERDLLKPLVKGKDIKAYNISWSGTYVIYPYDEHSKVIPEEKLKSVYPNVYKYFCDRRDELSKREYFNKSGKLWYELWNQRKLENFNKTRIVVPEISDNNNFALTDKYFGNTKTYHVLLKDDSENNILYVLGLLNSRLINFFYKNISTPYAGGFYAYKTQFLDNIPIKPASNEKKAEVATLVNEILMNRQSEDKSSLYNKLDQVVFSLYDLSKNEIAVIEAKND